VDAGCLKADRRRDAGCLIVIHRRLSAGLYGHLDIVGMDVTDSCSER
jgi:hypothetical protein